jgi:hypothetical protein
MSPSAASKSPFYPVLVQKIFRHYVAKTFDPPNLLASRRIWTPGGGYAPPIPPCPPLDCGHIIRLAGMKFRFQCKTKFIINNENAWTNFGIDVRLSPLLQTLCTAIDKNQRLFFLVWSRTTCKHECDIFVVQHASSYNMHHVVQHASTCSRTTCIIHFLKSFSLLKINQLLIQLKT